MVSCLDVVEFSDGLAASLVGKHLSNIGCSVHSFCNQSGMTPKTARALHSGKQRMELESVEGLLSSARVVVCDAHYSSRFGYDKCRSINPNIVFLFVPPYASEDVEFGEGSVHESEILAVSGVFSDMGLNRTLSGVRASFTHLPLASAYASIFSMLALMVALYEDRQGEYIEVPMASAVIESLIHNTLKFPIHPSYLSLRKQALARDEYPIGEAELEGLIDPFFSLYRCSCGRFVYLVCPAHVLHQEAVLRVLDIDYDRTLIPSVDTYASKARPGIGSGNLDASQAAHMRPLLKDAFARRTASWCCKTIGDAGVPISIVQTTDEWKRSEHAIRSGLIDSDGVAPLFWHHVVRNVRPKTAGPRSLSGIRVVDMTNVIAGPTIGSMLSRFGATVIKVDPTRPFYAPDITVIYGLAANVGKKSLLLDVKTEEGKQILARLLRDADVLTVNATQPSMHRLGLTDEWLQAVNPELVVMRFDAFGGPAETGPLSARIGYDDNVQALSGIMARFGGGLDSPEEHAHIGTIDVIAGVAGAAATVHGLLLRDVGGIVARCRTSLLSVAQYVQFPMMTDGEGPQVGAGRTCMGLTPHHCIYEARDGHVLLRARDTTAPALSDAYAVLRSRVAQMTCAECHEAFGTRFVVTRLGRMNALRDSFSRSAPKGAERLIPGTFAFDIHETHPIGDLVMAAPTSIRMRGVLHRLSPAPKYGRDGLDILRSVRASNAMRSDGPARHQYSENYLPFAPRCTPCGSTGHLHVLGCDHQVCDQCIVDSNGKHCPVCGARDDTLYRHWCRQWASSYRRWRSGAMRGAVSKTTTQCKQMVRSKSMPSFAYVGAHLPTVASVL